ncbi:MAG: hypothetical protein R3F59_33580 [Myxococcota bacterium]
MEQTLRQRTAGFALMVLGGVAVACAALAAIPMEAPGGFIAGLTVVVFGAVIAGVVFSGHRRAALRLAFARELCEQLDDDFLAGRKVALEVRLDASARDEYWRGRSQHGNTKTKYKERWFSLRFSLADGSEVRLVRKADVKTKKGSTVRHKRNLYVRLRPNPARFGDEPWDREVFGALVGTAIADGFHDPPEGFRVRTLGAGERDVDLKITQLDAGILADEVVAVLDAALGAHLRRLRPR